MRESEARTMRLFFRDYSFLYHNSSVSALIPPPAQMGAVSPGFRWSSTASPCPLFALLFRFLINLVSSLVFTLILGISFPVFQDGISLG